jgi:hypothetical protein
VAAGEVGGAAVAYVGGSSSSLHERIKIREIRQEQCN